MSVSDDAVLSAAIKFGERSADQAMKYALEVRRLRMVMRESIHLLAVGKIEQARNRLEENLK